jgi:hypothetical protein
MTQCKNELYKEYMRILKDDLFNQKDTPVVYKRTVLEEDLKIVYKHYHKSGSNKTEMFIFPNANKTIETQENVTENDDFDDDYEII